MCVHRCCFLYMPHSNKSQQQACNVCKKSRGKKLHDDDDDPFIYMNTTTITLNNINNKIYPQNDLLINICVIYNQNKMVEWNLTKLLFNTTSANLWSLLWFSNARKTFFFTLSLETFKRYERMFEGKSLNIMTQLTVSQVYYLILRCVVDIKNEPWIFYRGLNRLIIVNIFDDYSRLSKKYLILSNYYNFLHCIIDKQIQGIYFS